MGRGNKDKADENTVAGRLSIATVNFSTRAFADAMTDAGVKTSKGKVQNCLNGKSAPDTDWLKTAAGLTGYRPEWLAFRSGEPTPEEQAVADANRSKTPIERIAPEGVEISDVDAEWFRNEFEERCKIYKKLSPTVQLLFDATFARYVKHVLEEIDARQRNERLNAAVGLMNALKLGHMDWPPKDPRSPEFADYCVSMLHTVGLSFRAEITRVRSSGKASKRRR
jgi:hypothetical protein